jgi:hypothetical protein
MGLLHAGQGIGECGSFAGILNYIVEAELSHIDEDQRAESRRQPPRQLN